MSTCSLCSSSIPKALAPRRRRSPSFLPNSLHVFESKLGDRKWDQRRAIDDVALEVVQEFLNAFVVDNVAESRFSSSMEERYTPIGLVGDGDEVRIIRPAVLRRGGSEVVLKGQLTRVRR